VSEHGHGAPEPTVWPVTLAAGATLVAVSILTNAFVLVAGIVISLVAVAGWISLMSGSDRS